MPESNQASPRYVLLPEQRINLHQRALRAQRLGQAEVCGALVTDAKCRLGLLFLDNRTASPGCFKTRSSDLRAAQKAAKSMGKKTIGTFHSHPVSEAVPGRSDLLRAKLNSFMLIYDVCGREVRLWKIKKNNSGRTYKEVPILTAMR